MILESHSKKCTKCKNVYNLSNFSKNPVTKDGLAFWCKNCMKEVCRKYRQTHKTEGLEFQRKWRAANPDKVKKQSKRHYAENKDRLLEDNKRYRQENPHRHVDARLKREYGISLGEYNLILTQQGGGCAICGKKPEKRTLAVDHCHRTGKIRGLLCGKHNMALGLFDDDPELFKKAIAYLGAS